MDRRYEKSRLSWLSPSAGTLSLPIGLAYDPYQRRRVSLEGYLGVMERKPRKARPSASKTESHLLAPVAVCLPLFPKQRVAGSSPVSRSILRSNDGGCDIWWLSGAVLYAHELTAQEGHEDAFQVGSRFGGLSERSQFLRVGEHVVCHENSSAPKQAD